MYLDQFVSGWDILSEIILLANSFNPDQTAVKSHLQLHTFEGLKGQ